MFDSQIFCHQRFGGVSRYITSLVSEMAHIDGITPLIVSPLHFNDYLEQLPKSLVYGRKAAWLRAAPVLAYATSAGLSPIVGRAFKPQIVHNTYYHPKKPVRGARLVVTVYDMIHEKYPEPTWSNKLITTWKRASVKMADHVICISENTRRDVIDFFGVADSKVSVTHLSSGTLTREPQREDSKSFRLRTLGADVPYLLYVGNRQGYKNFAGLLQAYAASPWLRENFFILCFGGGGFTAQESTIIGRANAAGRILNLAGSDLLLAQCYSHASLFVFPSFYEGFGIPPLEAMSLDCPVACGNSSSLPEVVGDAAELFDPKDSDSIRLALESALNSPQRRATLIERGRTRKRLFSWRECAKKTVSVYANLLARS